MNYSLKSIIIASVLFVSQSIFGQQQKLKTENYQKVDSLFKSYFKPDKTGAAFAIIKNEQTVYKNHIGLANIEYQKSITDSTIFNIASVSKQFTTFLALLLEEEGKLSFNDDIRNHLPELKHLPNKITIKQLTNHTHGLPNPDELSQLKGIHTMAHQEVLEMLLNIKQVNFETGEQFEYNNTGYILLSQIIERVGKKPFQKQLEEKIFKPLGMYKTQAIGNKNTIVNNKAYSYSISNNNYVNFPIRLSTMGSSGINTTIDDLGLWIKNYQNTKVGKPEFYEKMQTATILNSGQKITYGLGLEYKNYKGIDIVFHGGGTESYRSYILHAPKYKVSLVFLSNAGGFSGLDVIYKSLEIILKEALKSQKTINYQDQSLDKFAGNYEMFPGTYYTILSENGKLYFQDFGTTQKVLLPQIRENVFKVPFIPHSSFIFSKGKFVFQIADFNYNCMKTTLKLPNTEDVSLNDFVGIYKNIEHNTSYELVIKDNKLTAIHASINYNISLNALAENSFYSKEPFFGKLDFTLNADQKVVGFKLSGQNLKNIKFEKISSQKK